MRRWFTVFSLFLAVLTLAASAAQVEVSKVLTATAVAAEATQPGPVKVQQPKPAPAYLSCSVCVEDYNYCIEECAGNVACAKACYQQYLWCRARCRP
jgi:hypothetical protein